jgi:hypothetical protein
MNTVPDRVKLFWEACKMEKMPEITFQSAHVTRWRRAFFGGSDVPAWPSNVNMLHDTADAFFGASQNGDFLRPNMLLEARNDDASENLHD